MKKTSKMILMSVLTIAMCVSLISGATFALFSSESKTNIVISSGKVDMQASVDNLKTFSYELGDSGEYESTEQAAGKFIYGTAELSDDATMLTLSNLVPGDKATFDVAIQNASTIATQYRTIVSCEEDTGLFAGLKVTIGGRAFAGYTAYTDWTALDAEIDPDQVEVIVELPYDAGNEYMEKSCTITYKVEAVQGNASVENIAADSTGIFNGSDIKQLCSDVNAGNTDAESSFELAADIDMSVIQGEKWPAIGTSDNRFRGTFNGNGHRIYGLTTNCLFNYIDSGATVENFSLDVHLVDSGLDTATGLAYIAYGSPSKVTTFRDITLTGELSGSNVYAAFFYNVTSFSAGTDGAEKGTEVLIENCVNEMNVTSRNTNRAVGFIGTNYSASTTFRNCVNKGNISLTTTVGTNGAHAGAFVGYSMATSNIQNYRITFEQCVNEGNVSSNSGGDGRINVGGFMSTAQGGSVTFIDCRNEGDVTAINNLDSAGNCIVGGLLGCDNRAGIVITNCTNSGTITGTVEKEINTGCNPQVGGLVGGSSGDGTVVFTDCTSIGEITANPKNETKFEGLLCGTSGRVTVTIKGNVWLLQDDIDNETALVASASKITEDSDYTKVAYTGE